MADNDQLKEFQGVIAELTREQTNFHKDGPSRYTGEYKKRKTSKAISLYEKAKKLITEIEKWSTVADPCFELEKKNLEINFTKYMDLLKAIPDKTKDEPQQEGQLGNPSPDPMPMFLQQQDVRFENIRKIIEDVDKIMLEEATPTRAYCKLKLKSLQDAWGRIQTSDEESTVERSKLPDDYFEKMEEFEGQIERVCLQLEQILEEGNRQSLPKNDDVKLPRVTIPKFHGDYFKWVSFKDLFCAMVKDKTNLSNGQKMQMLKTLVDGEAAAIIVDLTIADVNFDSAWDRLLDRYDNNRVVVYKHLHRLITQPAAKNESKTLKKLLDTTDQVLLALQNMGRPIDKWDDWIIITVTQKLNEEARKDWERKIGDSTDLPKWEQLKKFLGEQFRMLEGIENNNKREHTKAQETAPKNVIKSYQASINMEKCPACQDDHRLFNCSVFKGMDVKKRWDMAKKQKLCFACLSHHEDKLKCDKPKPCKKCNRKHSTWLHENRKEEPKESAQTEVKNAHGQVYGTQSPGLLATIVVLVQNEKGQQFFLRALADSGSQASMITSKAAALLDMDLLKSTAQVTVLGGNNTGKAELVHMEIQPRFTSTFTLNLGCYVMKKLTEPLPNHDLEVDSWDHIKGLTLADPMFNKVGSIDLLLGSDAIGEILLPELRKGPQGTPMAQKTKLGWIIFGRYDSQYERKAIKCNVATIHETDDDDINLSRFWEIEDLNQPRKLTKDEETCEEIFRTTHSINQDGTFVVKIPFKQDGKGPSQLGDSRKQCMARLMYLEKRFKKDEELKKEYTKVMQEYIDMGHMKEVSPREEKLYYIPHHAVIKPDSLTTKTRVVFDASAKTTTGVSLNECMYIGAKQQDDLLDILLRWRMFKVVFKADITKMYRMIKLDAEDQKYHTILWRKDQTEPIKEYQLNTVTFGTAAAPFLATRTLKQIAENNQDTNPLAAKTIRDGFYVDDLIYGSDTVEDAIQRKDETIRLLQQANLHLRKWSSNDSDFMKTIPAELAERSLQSFTDEETTKALGLQWNPKSDNFEFAVNWDWDSGPLTKRKLLSQASKLFDPLGWCSPVILNAKLIMQKVWISNIHWDELVAPEIQEKWIQLRDEFTSLRKLTIPRWIGLEKQESIQLHGFSDASEKAYSAVVYTRVVQDGQVIIRIIAAKTRVAPIKTKTTLPRMELCGAVLLTNLMMAIKTAMQRDDVEMIAWSDSTVTLGWLKGEPLKWRTFVANRVSEIQSTMISNWRYCPSEDNPADCASRGLMPIELMKHSLWWTGPSWLKESEDKWPTLQVEDTEMEQRTVAVNVATIERNELLLRNASWFRTLRVLAYCFRMKKKQTVGSRLTVDEIEAMKVVLIKQCQQASFSEEINDLNNKRSISSKSKLLNLNPFLDDEGILRVGGRLQNAIIPENMKHPIILPKEHRVTNMIIQQMHMDTLHGGPQLMLTLLRKKYWILHGKRTVTDLYKKCLNCKRFKAETIQQMMGNLPKERVTLERAFLHTGVDYCGPIEIRSSKLRGSRLQKGYIAVFVCLGTKAVHLELVSDCSTPAFTAAFNRFIARRGLCNTMFSDNGTNFVGAYNQLAKQEREWLHSKNLELADLVISKGIEWKFIPPGAPNFGGIWERNVRSVKDHLKRTLKTTRLTFEEYGTVLCQIEACLNSRPLQPLTNDTENLNALTPGHFLIGEALMAPPQQSLVDNNANRLDRWKHLQLLQQHFWNRWNQEYLNQLQQRQKWKKGTEQVHVGDLVLVKDEQLPPRNWLLARIQETHPGTDGRVRVVTLRTSKGQLKRPINKICPLLKNDELENEPLEIAETSQGETVEDHEVEEHDLGPDVTPVDEQKPIERVKLVKPIEPSHSYNLRPKTMTVTLAIIFGIMIMIGGGSALEMEKMVKMTEFQNNAGIYFEELGRAQAVKSIWNINIRFDLVRYRQDIKRLRSIEQDLIDLCTDMDSQGSRSVCEDTVGLVSHQLRMIDDLNTVLEYHGDEVNLQLRKRRAAPMNGVGWIQHELFGVMASSEAERIDQHFEEVKKDSLYMTQLLKNQTSILDSTVNLMRISQQEVNKNYERIENQITLLYNETNMVKRRVKAVSLSLFTVALVNRVAQVQENLLDMVTDLHQGHVSSHIFSPQQFKEQLEIMRNNLPMDSVVPEVTHYDIKALYKIITGSARVTDKYIVVDVHFPLVSRDEFQLWHVIPIPTQHEKYQITIIPDSEFLMINLQRSNFYTLEQQDVRTCLRPRERMFLCNLKQPMYTTKSTVSVCERNLLNHHLELDSTCKLTLTSEKEFWIGLTMKNHWIYGTIKPKTLNIVCGTTAQQLVVNGSGILEIMAGCEVNQPGITLIAESIKQTNGDFNYYPLVNLSDAVTRSSSKGESGRIKMLNLTLDHSAQLDSLSAQLHELDQQTNVHSSYHIWHSGGHTFSILMISSMILLTWFNRTRILEFVATWTNQLETDDVEMSNVDQTSPQHGRPDVHHNSDDISRDSNTVNSHEGGRCPFRT